MMRATWTHHAGSSTLHNPEYSGFSGVARYLTEVLGHEITKQYVWISYQRRVSNGFPEKRLVQLGNGSQTLQLFNLDEVLTWYRSRPRQVRHRDHQTC